MALVMTFLYMPLELSTAAADILAKITVLNIVVLRQTGLPGLRQTWMAGLFS